MFDAATMGGTWYLVPTPFDESGDVDHASLARLVDAAISWGVDGLTVMGVMSEPGTLSTGERSSALRTVFDAAQRRVPIVVGCSAAAPAAALGLVAEARDLGAAAAMVAAPPLLRNVDALPAFFAAIAGGGLPLVIQDEPNATGVTIPVSVLLAAAASSGARPMKIEDPPTPPKIARLRAADAGLRLFGGLGGASALGELRRGAVGTMTGFAYPEVLRAVRLAWEAGRRDEAAHVFDRYLPLIVFEAQPVVGLPIRKEILRRRGAIRCAATRGLGGGLDVATLDELDDVLARVRVVPASAPLVVDVGQA